MWSHQFALTPQLTGQYNRLLILNYVKNHGVISRADLVRELGLSFPTVSSNVQSLLDGKFLLEIGEGSNTLGRKSTLLSFNKDRGCVLSIDVGRFTIRSAVADLSGNIILQKDLDTNLNDNISLTDKIIKLFDELINESGKTYDSVLCIAAGTPGVEDSSGALRIAPFLPDISIKALRLKLKDKYANAHIIVDNSIKMGALGEAAKGSGVDFNNFVLINYGVGIGAALILDRKLYKGSHNIAGEIGFMLPSYKDKMDSFDPSGSFERLLTIFKHEKKLSNAEFIDKVQALLKAYRSNEEKAVKIFRTIIEAFSVSVINIAAVLDVDAIIISGGFGISVVKEFADELRSMLQKQVPHPPKIIFSALNNNEGVIGGISVAIDWIHSSPENLFTM